MSTTPGSILVGMYSLRTVAEAYRDRMIRKRLTWLAQRLRNDAVAPPWLLQSLVTCWMNPWSVDSYFLAGLLRWYGKTSGPVLECGSGLTTLVLVTAAWTKARPSVSLEDDARWKARIEAALPKQARSWLDCRVVPLVDHGDFDWYDVEAVNMPNRIGLVVCDGPKGTTRGGRYGLAPVMKDRLAPGCVVLLDDSSREAERAIIERWCAELPARVVEVSERYSAIEVGVTGSSSLE
jgi:hypothetical protein